MSTADPTQKWEPLSEAREAAGEMLGVLYDLRKSLARDTRADLIDFIARQLGGLMSNLACMESDFNDRAPSRPPRRKRTPEHPPGVIDFAERKAKRRGT